MNKYLISIESSESSRLKIFFNQTIFLPYKSDFTKIGIIGKNLSVTEYFNLAVASQKKPLSPGELGCTLSHVAALKDFVASQSNYALIVEDDAIQVNYFDLSELEQEINKLNLQQCFFFSLGGVQLTVNSKLRGRIEPKQILGKNILKLHPFSIANLCYTYAYIVDKSMAQLLIDYHKIPHVCDHWDELYKLNKEVNFYVTFLLDHPEVAENKNIVSNIEEERKQMGGRGTRKSLFKRLRNSVIKKWLKLFYQKYES